MQMFKMTLNFIMARYTKWVERIKGAILHAIQVVTEINCHRDKLSVNLSNLCSVNNKITQSKEQNMNKQALPWH